MRYLFIPIGLTALLLIYAFYLLVIKKDTKKFKTVLYPGLIFIAVWAVMYYLFIQ